MSLVEGPMPIYNMYVNGMEPFLMFVVCTLGLKSWISLFVIAEYLKQTEILSNLYIIINIIQKLS